MKKTLKIIVSLVLILGLLVACNENEGSTSESPSTTNQKQNVVMETEKKVKKNEEVEETEEEKELEETEEEIPVEKDDSEITLLHPMVSDIKSFGNNGDRLLASSRYGLVGLNVEEEKLYPKLKAALKEENELVAENWNESFVDLIDIGEEFFSNEENGIYDRLYDELKVDVVRADSVVFSIHHYFTYFSGGAHGFYTHSGENFDAETGEKLLVSDVITDMDRLGDIIEDKLVNDPEGQWIEQDVYRQHFKDLKQNEAYFAWLIDYEGVSFFFNPNDIAAYAAGMYTVYLPFEEYPDLFVEKYTKAAENYVMPLIPYRNNFFNWDDEEMTAINIRYIADEYGALSDVIVEIDSEINELDMYCMEINPYVVRNHDKYYLYLFYIGENYYQSLKIFDIKNNQLVEVAEIENLGVSLLDTTFEYLDDEQMSTRSTNIYPALTDPNDLVLDSLLYALSTVTGTREYYTTKAGMVEAYEDYYRVDDQWRYDWLNEFEELEWTFTTKVELEMNLVDENLKTGESIVLPVGTDIKYIRTDNESWADFRLDDGREVRAKIVLDEFTINGIDIMDALDGVMFAG